MSLTLVLVLVLLYISFLSLPRVMSPVLGLVISSLRAPWCQTVGQPPASAGLPPPSSTMGRPIHRSLDDTFSSSQTLDADSLKPIKLGWEGVIIFAGSNPGIHLLSYDLMLVTD
jgi:hypothetical protein